MLELSKHEQSVIAYYATQTEEMFMSLWDREDVHFGIFDQELIARLGKFPKLGDLSEALRKMTDVIIGPADIRDGEMIVDAGSGIGGASRYIAQTFDCTVTGVNISEKQIQIAESRTADAGLQDRVTFRHGNCSRHLPFETSSVDVIVNIESACHYADRATFLRECARILKPGGRLAASDWMAGDGISPEDYRAHAQPVCDTWFFQSMETLSSYRQLLEQTGFQVLESETLGDEVLENARIMDRIWRFLWLKIGRSEVEKMWMDQFRYLSRAWLKGHFEIGRYLAVAPQA